MSITVRETAKGITIRTTGADALRLLANMAAGASPQAPASAPNPVPNRPKTKVVVLGAAGLDSVSMALRAKVD